MFWLWYIFLKYSKYFTEYYADFDCIYNEYACVIIPISHLYLICWHSAWITWSRCHTTPNTTYDNKLYLLESQGKDKEIMFWNIVNMVNINVLVYLFLRWISLKYIRLANISFRINHFFAIENPSTPDFDSVI